MSQCPNDPPLKRYFSGLTESTFQGQLGVADPPLIDYLVELLTRFIHADRIYSIRTVAGQRLEEVAQMAVEAEARAGDARREVHRHIGDFTLFWSGVFPEALRRLQSAPRLDYMLDYQQQGKRAYHIASTIAYQKKPTENAVLERLSDQFELVAYGLRQVRTEWERAAAEGGDAAGGLLLN